MTAVLLLHWHYLIFVLPFGMAALLLLLSSLRMGRHHGGHSGHSHAVVHGASHGGAHIPVTAHAHAGANTNHPHTAHAGAARPHSGPQGQARTPGAKAGPRNSTSQPNLLLHLVGIGRAPLPLLLEVFFLVWGLSGCLANQWLLPHLPSPSLTQMLPSLGIAAGSGLVGARLAAELMARLMPEEESLIVSRAALFGLKGKVAFPVTETGGRVLIYDEFGSLHDETCRITPGHSPIARGCSVIVMDRDARGNLIVEEVVE